MRFAWLYLRAVHQNALAFSELVTLTPLAYPVMLAPAAVLVGFVAILDPEELER